MIDAELKSVLEPEISQHGVEQTVRSVAKEIAAAFYEESIRSPGFRKAFPTLQHYMRGQWVQPNGSIKLYRPGWLHFVDTARKRMAMMLGESSTSEYLKYRIFDALIEDRNRQFKAGAVNRKNVKDLPQAKLGMQLDD
jgi:hypothetical protein